MNDQTACMTLTGPDGTEAGPFSMDQLTAASAQVVEPLTAQAAALVIEHKKCSTSFVQRQLAIGYNKAAGIVEALEALGVVTASDHVGHREVVATEVPKELELASAAQKMVSRPMKETEADVEVRDKAYRVTANELRSFVERVERLDAEKKDIADQQKEVMAEARSRGYDVKILRKVVALRKREADDIAEEEAVLDMYREALGM